GHLIFMLGLALTFASWFALMLFAARAVWFHRRVLEDEARLQAMFGAPYLDYQRRVERWSPGLFLRGAGVWLFGVLLRDVPMSTKRRRNTPDVRLRRH